MPEAESRSNSPSYFTPVYLSIYIPHPYFFKSSIPPMYVLLLFLSIILPVFEASPFENMLSIVICSRT